MDSGYDHKTRMKITRSAVRILYRQVTDQESGGQKIYRSSADMAKSRRLKPLLTKNWFKSKRGGKKVTVVKNLPQHQREAEKLIRKEARKE